MYSCPHIFRDRIISRAVYFHQLRSLFSSPNFQSQFVPKSDEANENEIKQLQHFLDSHPKIFVLTGAGASTASGIPDYRSEAVGLYATSPNRPVQFSDFLRSETIRQRYWARNFVGWPKFSSLLPNQCHYILKDWEKKKKLNWLVTQNVDALHFKAGSKYVIELHGSGHRVVCLSCKNIFPRNGMQEMMRKLNPQWTAEALNVAPDGDVDLDAELVKSFQVPTCARCGGTLKPEITFFGDNVPKSTVQFSLKKMFESDAVLVVGSSLQVYSGYRFIAQAHERDMKIAIVNIGPTRGDKEASLKISAACGNVLERVTV